VKTVHVRYFAILREERGLEQETISTAASTAADLYGELRALHGFTLPPSRLRVAINDDLEPWSATFQDGDALVFIPPVSGG
jgi:molybdopterin converting factor small subunit